MVGHGVGEHLARAAGGAARRVVVVGGDGGGAIELLAQLLADQVAMAIVFEGGRARSVS